jgi:mitochondrial chaperone BCS1
MSDPEILSDYFQFANTYSNVVASTRTLRAMDVSFNSSVNMSSIQGPSLIEIYLSGLSLASQLLSTYLRIDVSSYIPYIILLSAVAASLQLKPRKIAIFLKKCFMSSIEIQANDEVFDSVESWAAENLQPRRITHLIARTRTGGWFRFNGGEKNDDKEYMSTKDSSKVYYMRHLSFTPAEGFLHWFWFRNRLVFFTREVKHGQWLFSESLHLKCFGWDTSILQDIIHEARIAYADRDNNKTVVYRGQLHNKMFRWIRTQTRPIRELSTVIMDEKVKEDYITDAREYLRPETRHWYTKRGIPYRRGYLFHGPPGTGKTSLCFAAAGALGLPIYMLSLNSLTEDGLNELVSSLPRRCILLLEDVDTNSVTNARTAEVNTASHQETPDNNRNDDRSLTLSGVLNAFDGVAASEGRILVMTSNHWKNLDPALLRPGRIDMKIEFMHPKNDEIERLFQTMYSIDDLPESDEIGDSRKAFSSSRCNLKQSSRIDSIATNSSNDVSESLADKFAASFPPKRFSQADIQGYLLKYPKLPELAVERVCDWIRKELGEH